MLGNLSDIKEGKGLGGYEGERTMGKGKANFQVGTKATGQQRGAKEDRTHPKGQREEDEKRRQLRTMMRQKLEETRVQRTKKHWHDGMPSSNNSAWTERKERQRRQEGKRMLILGSGEAENGRAWKDDNGKRMLSFASDGLEKRKSLERHQRQTYVIFWFG